MGYIVPVTVMLVYWLAFTSGYTVKFEPLAKLYLPYTYDPSPEFEVDKDAAEQMAYDPTKKLLYSVGHTNIHVINMANLHNMRVLYNVTYPGTDVTDVEVCGDYVFVAFDNSTVREDGFVNVYRSYDVAQHKLELLHHIVVGDIPDMIHSTADCSRLIIAIEAEPYDDDTSQRLVDNPGGVVILKFNSQPDQNYSITKLDFQAFDSQYPTLEKSGVRQIYAENGNPFSNDVEPEYIAVNEEETVAYISLQENNAIAVVDLVTETITGIHGLGFKEWNSGIALDTSDKDGGIFMRPYPIYGMYQPDSIKIYRWRGEDYIITANEGDSKDYQYFSEEERVKHLVLSDKFERNQTTRQLLQGDDALGRLKVSTQNGKNPTSGQYDALYAFGGRSFSIWRAGTMQQVYDSGDEISRKVASLKRQLFNADVDTDLMPSETFDTRSDDKGPETESVVLGHFNDVTLVIVGNERPGFVAVYSIDERLPTIQPRFETLLYDITRTNDTWNNLVVNNVVSMLDPEDMKFLSASESPTGRPLLLVSGSVSGTINVFSVDVTDAGADDDVFPSDSVDRTKISLIMVLFSAIILQLLV